MRKQKVLALLLLMVSCMTGMARQVTDTIYSSQNDSVFVTYDVVEKDGKIEIRFIKVRKKLCRENGNKYGDDLSYVKVLCFDREYDFKDIVIKGHLSPKLFMIPERECVYTPSEDGYFVIDDKPVLHFGGHPTKPTTLSIPMFLAHYKERKIKKSRPYELFAQCSNLKIELGQNQEKSQPIESKTQVDAVREVVSEQTIEMEEEVSAFSDNENNALYGALYVIEQLSSNKQLNYESLSQEVENLRKLKHQIQSEEVVEKVEMALQAYENHMDRLAKEKRIQDSINEVKLQQEQLKEKEEAEQKEAQERRQKMLMIIGGVLLAILLFVGKQVMQGIQAKKNQANMAKAQEEAMKKAQEMARQQQQQLQQQANGEIQNPNKKRYTI